MEALFLFHEAVSLEPLLYAAAGRAAVCGRAGAGAAGEPAITAATAREPQEVAALAPEWRALEARVSTPATAFQGCDLHLVWARHFCDARTALRVVTIRSNGRLVLLWPLAVRQGRLGGIAEWAGDPIGQYGDVIVAQGAGREGWIEAAFDEIRRWGDVSYLRLRAVRADSAIAGWARRRGTRIGPEQEAPALDHSAYGSGEEFARDGWSQVKRNAKRIRKLRGLGDTVFEMVHPGPEAVALVRRAFDFKRAWLDRQGHLGRAFLEPRLEACLSDLAGDPAIRSGLVLSHLAVGEETAAIEVGLRHGGCHYAFMGAFSPDFARHSPGSILTEMTIRACIEDGLGQYDPLPPADDYKLAWSNHRIKVHDYGFRLRAGGLLPHAEAAWLSPFAKAAYERLPLRLRRILRSAMAGG